VPTTLKELLREEQLLEKKETDAGGEKKVIQTGIYVPPFKME
jgi:hypothetical protein